jgi:two-component system, chemotaxis family, CheB/CheR fusion protein
LKTSATPGAFAADIEGRIAAVARAHSRLTDDGRGAASLKELIVTELAPYNRAIANITIGGAPVALTPKAGLALAMAIHELASNAAKYGALSKPTGVLSVTWRIESREVRVLDFSCIASGGPPIAGAPSRRGFGTTLFERTLSHEFDATVKREFLPSGYGDWALPPWLRDQRRLTKPFTAAELEEQVRGLFKQAIQSQGKS